MDDRETTDGHGTRERAKVERPEPQEWPRREVLKVGELPDDVVKEIEEAEYDVESI